MSGAPLSRLAAVVDGLAADAFDALLVTNPTDLRWLTGFTGSNGLALVGADWQVFLTDFRYVTQSADQVDDRFERRIITDRMAGVAAELASHGVARLGINDVHMTVKEHGALVDAAGDGVELVPSGALVGGLRAVKDAAEIARIRAAAALADEAFAEVVLNGPVVGRTEREVALDLEIAMRRRGAQGLSFAPIIAAGPHGALPHAEPRDVPIAPDTLLVVDWGAHLDGYASDCTRTVATGTLDATATDIYDLVLLAQRTSLAAVAPGPTGAEVDAVARGIIEAAGHGDQFGHGLGHGVGLEVHEEPRLSRISTDTLVAGHVVTVEPGVYVPGVVGVRIEDLVAVTADGFDVLNGLSKELVTVS